MMTWPRPPNLDPWIDPDTDTSDPWIGLILDPKVDACFRKNSYVEKGINYCLILKGKTKNMFSVLLEATRKVSEALSEATVGQGKSNTPSMFQFYDESEVEARRD